MLATDEAGKNGKYIAVVFPVKGSISLYFLVFLFEIISLVCCK